jgi:uncharacterized membrane-anchored protein
MKNSLVKFYALRQASVAKKTKQTSCGKHLMVVVFVLQYWQLILVFLVIRTINGTVEIALKMIVLMMIGAMMIGLKVKDISVIIESAMSVRVDGGMRPDLAQHQHKKGPRARSPCVILAFAIPRV